MTVINTNVGALMARTYTTRASDKMQTSMERLSSGLRINSAADDAAGLAVANKMASQLSGIKMAIRNSQDGISLVQTAESGMSQISSMVLRMRELAVQMENGIYTDKDRDNAEMEDRALRAEVDKVVSNTRFNDVSLLDGSYDQAIRSGNVNAETIRISIDGMTSLVNEDSYLPQSLSDIANGNGGFVVNGVGAGDRAGIFTSNAGDVNGDGLDDFIIGADNDDPGGRNDSGAAFVVFGRRDGGKVELSDIEAGIGGFVINGVSAGDSAGEGVSGGGDINGDGLADLIVGALHDDPNGDSSGAAFVVFGKKDTAAVELSAVESGAGGFVINGASAGDRAGYRVSNAQDVNGDGLTDILVTAHLAAPNGGNSGAAFVVFGKKDTTAVELSAVQGGTGGFVMNGVGSGDRAGRSASTAGDVNGDGYSDLLVGAPTDDPNGDSSGAAFVVFGKTGTTAIDLSNVESGIGGFVINGASAGDQAGVTTAYAGDINGDGLDDLLVGAKFADPGGRNDAGASYVVFGKKDTAAIELSNVESGTGGFVINGKVAGDHAASVGTAGDFNGDGLNDILVGAPEADTSGADSGSAYLIFGKNNTSAVELSKVEEGAGGFALNGVSAGHLLGLHSNGGGDINGDGYSDLVIGARGAAPNGADSGAAYVVYGVGRIGILDKALEEVSTAQSKLGAVQNRLIHNINNLSKSSMLTEQSVGRILDADFATETSGVSKQQILNQAATAMLAQANMSKQSVLVLLE